MKLGLVAVLVVMSVLVAVPAYAGVTAWHFSESDGSPTVTSDSGVVATLENDNDPNGVVVDDGRLVFNGHGRAVVSESVADLDPSAQPFTASAVVNTTEVPSDQIGDFDLVRDGLSTHKRYWKVELFPNAANTKAFAFCQMRGFVAGSGHRGIRLKWTGANLANGVDHVIECAKTDSQVTLSVDGDVRVTKNITIGSIYNAAALSIGAKAETWQDTFTGTLDDVSLTVG